MTANTQATIEDLYLVRESGKAEIVNGELRLISPTGDMPSRAGLAIVVSLHAHERRTGKGRCYPDNAAFIVTLPNRRSFSPDAAYYLGPRAGGGSSERKGRPNGRWLPTVVITLPPGLWWFGTWTC